MYVRVWVVFVILLWEPFLFSYSFCPYHIIAAESNSKCNLDLICRTKFLNASSYQKIKSKRQRKTPTRKKNGRNWLTLMLRHSATESCTLRCSVCVVWRKMVKCHVHMLSQYVCLYQDARLLWLPGSVRRCSCSYLFGRACDCRYRREFHIPHAIPFNQPKVFSLSVQQLFDR